MGSRVRSVVPLIVHVFDNDIETLLKIREFTNYLPSSNKDEIPAIDSYDSVDRIDPALNTLVPENPNRSYDMLELIERVVDNGEFFEINHTSFIE